MESKIAGAHHEKFARYFIAIIPPQPAYQEIEKLKNDVSDRYHSKAALNSPPHITLHMPFEWKREKEALLCDRLKTFSFGMDHFEVELLNFSCFAPRTVFIQVTMTSALEHLERELHRFCKTEFNIFNARYQNLPFHPHITVAFRDLNKTIFASVWDEFKQKTFTAKFNVVNIALLKHNGKLWEPLHYFSLT